MSGIAIDDASFDAVNQSLFTNPTLELETAEEAKRVRLEGLSGSRETPVERITNFASDPVGNIIEPTSAALTDVGSGVITGLAGVAQLSSTVQETTRQGLDWLVGEDYTDEEKEAFIQDNITDPEIARQAAYSKYRQKVSQKKPSPIAGFIGEVFPTLVANPKKAAQGFFGKVLQSTFYGGLSGSMEFVEGGVNERNMNILIGNASGGILDILQQLGRRGWQIAKEAYKPSLRDFAATDQVDIAQKLSTEETVKVIKAAKELGITVTPAEASGDTLLIHGQNTLNVNEASREQLAEFLAKRNDSLTENILALQRVADKDLQYAGVTFIPSASQTAKAPFVTKSDEIKYKKTRENVLRQTLEPSEMKAVFNAHPMLAKLNDDYQKALRKPASKRTKDDVLKITAFKNLHDSVGIEGSMPINNVGYLDMLINNLDDLLENTVAGSSKEARDQALLLAQRKALSGVLKRNVEGYEALKNLQQRRIAVNNLQTAVDTSVVREEDYAEAFYNNVLKNKKKREELLRQLSTDPQAQKKVNDLTTVMSHIFSDANVAKLVRRSEPDILAQGTGGLGRLGTAALKLRELVRNDAGLINVITNPQWTSDISKLKGRTADETLQNLAAFLSRVVNTSDKIEQGLSIKEQTREELVNRVIQQQ